MAVTVTTDLVVRHSMDAITNVVGVGGVLAPTAADLQITVLGGACRSKVNAVGVGGNAGNFVNADLTGLHVFGWANNLDPADTNANGGWRLRIAANAAITTNFGEWTVAGSTNGDIRTNGGFVRFCANVDKPFDFRTGAAAALTGIGSIAVITNQLTASGRETWFIDSVDTATFIRIAGGTAGDPGTAKQISADDTTTGRGMFQELEKPFYALGNLLFGPATAVASEFVDSNQTVVFRDQPVSAGFHRLTFVGGAAVANNFKFGTITGTGVAEEASGGFSFVSAGAAPFRVTANDANITALHFGGCTFTGPNAEMSDAPRSVLYSPATVAYTNVTRTSGHSLDTTLWMPAAEDVGSFGVVGHEVPFNSVKITLGATAGVGGVIVWEYWNGTAWVALTNVTDGTAAFTVAGEQTVSFSQPPDWAAQNLSATGSQYHIRHRVTTLFTTNPNFTKFTVQIGGRVELGASTVKAIRCVFTKMDTIRVRNGAFIKKCTITNSVAPAKSAALDLGATDPAADTVRDLTIQNCSKGILLQKTAVGNVTYNFRNIKFSGNTADVRVDFPAASTVTINILEGGSTPTIDNVNASTVVVNNTVVVKVTAKDAISGVVLQNARVLLEAAAGGDLVAGVDIIAGLTDASGIIQNTGFNFTNPQPVTGTVRKSTASPFYKASPISGTITSAGLDLTILMIPDE